MRRSSCELLSILDSTFSTQIFSVVLGRVSIFMVAAGGFDVEQLAGVGGDSESQGTVFDTIRSSR